MNQKEIKSLKNKIQQEGAINVGYYPTIIPKITELFPELIAEFAKDLVLQGAEVVNIDNAIILNAFVTKAIEKMNYQEFKELAPYFLDISRLKKRLWQNLFKLVEESISDFKLKGNSCLNINSQRNHLKKE